MSKAVNPTTTIQNSIIWTNYILNLDCQTLPNISITRLQKISYVMTSGNDQALWVLHQTEFMSLSTSKVPAKKRFTPKVQKKS